MKNIYLKNWLKKLSSCIAQAVTLTLINLHFAFADTFGGDLPFDTTMEKLERAITGSFLLAVATIMIVITCLMLAFGEWGDGFKKIINIVLWLSVAFAVPSFIAALFGGGAVF